MRKIFLALSVFAAALVSSASPVTAQDATTSANTETICTTSSYGQVECVSTTDTTVTESGRLVKAHDMTDTGLDQTGLITTFGLMVTGSVIAINKFKNRS